MVFDLMLLVQEIVAISYLKVEDRKLIVYVLASLSGRGVVCSSQRFGCRLGIMDVFGDKDCLNSAAFWRHIGTCFPDQIGIDSKNF